MAGFWAKMNKFLHWVEQNMGWLVTVYIGFYIPQIEFQCYSFIIRMRNYRDPDLSIRIMAWNQSLFVLWPRVSGFMAQHLWENLFWASCFKIHQGGCQSCSNGSFPLKRKGDLLTCHVNIARRLFFSAFHFADSHIFEPLVCLTSSEFPETSHYCRFAWSLKKTSNSWIMVDIGNSDGIQDAMAKQASFKCEHESLFEKDI